jgi:tetratricopeptide (TPR) repeat protein
MGMFHALDRAYPASRTSADAVSYEGHLWKALAETLKRPLEEGNDLVIVVDGLDEVTGSQNAPSEVFERLSTICQEGKRVKLIAFSSSLSFPQSSHVTHQKIAPDDVREDLHAVALKALIHNRYFHGKSGPEQENVLDQVVRTANGSFLWTILACELLYLANSNEVMTKTLSNFESSHPAVEELVLRLTTSLDLQDNAKAVLSWILAAERPFTVDEINTLSSIDVPRGVISDKGIDTLSAFKSLNPLLAVHDRIVRFRHHTIQVSLRKVIQQGKLTVPIKERETDVLLRLLTYIKSVLKERGEPSIDPADLSDRIFHRHPFLEYAVRYWVSHLQQSPLAPKSSKEFKASSDLQKAFPDTTLLPILEHVCWDSQLAAPQALDWYNLVATVRRNILTENHPAVLQTYLNIASRYTTIAKVTESRDWYYLSTKISRTVLSDIHPLTLECASRFLQLTQGTTSGTRTDIATHREEILVILITAYERQYGSTSDQVIQARRLLLDLYVSIQEHDRATELFRLIQDATIEHYGKQSKEVRDLQEHLGVSLDKRKDFHNLDGYEDAFFDDRNDDTDYETDHFDIDSVSVYLRTAEKYLSQGQVGFAERVYVELWQEVSSKCRSVRDVRWHEQHIDVAEAYTRFLEEQKRSTEASAVLTCIWQHYEHHELSFAQTILSRLVGVAKLMKTLGNYTMALSIFQFASSHFRNSRKEESSLSREVTQEVASTSTELVKQSLASSTTATETTTTVSETVFQDVFHSVISSSKNVDSATMALAKKLTVQYMEKRNWSAAVNVIKATLERTWHSFNAGSIHDVTMTSTFTNESIELVERLVECYLQLKQVDRVEEIYVRLFRAALGTSNSDKAIFAKAKTLLIGFYDKYGYVDNAIGVFQELLILHRKSLGPTHELTIQTLYTLASRCRAHPRNHPYWLEYYQQIVSSLNKDSDLCHKDAMDAIIIVATSYWEDRRYAEAVTVFRVLWNTFVRKRKEFNQLVEVDFVQRLYERYFQCLEETKTSWETMYKVTKEFHEVTASAFGADSTISAEATLALAEVAHRSEEHVAEAISLYEHASKSSKVTTTRISHIKQALSSLYIYQLQSQSASSIKAETVERAISMRSEQYAEAARKYGYTHETTLAHLRELAILYNRQQKTDVLLKQLTTATVEIITNETSSQKMIEAATSIATTFEACQQVQRRSELIQELHRQIIAKDTRHSSKWSFDLTKCRQSTLAFLAALEYSSRQDLSITLSEMMADITAEWIYYENFRRVLTGKESMKNTLFSAAPLRWFLLRRQQTGLATGVEDEVVKTFMKRDASDLHVLSKSSPRIFIVTILDYLGSGKSKNFNRCVIKASNDKVASLTKAKKFAEAYDIGNLGFLFATNHDGYNGPNSMGMGFKLASLLVGRDSEKCPDADLRKKLLELSNRIVKKIIDICKQLQVNFARVQLLELSELSALLGEQQDYATLEVGCISYPIPMRYLLTYRTVAS